MGKRAKTARLSVLSHLSSKPGKTLESSKPRNTLEEEYDNAFWGVIQETIAGLAIVAITAFTSGQVINSIKYHRSNGGYTNEGRFRWYYEGGTRRTQYRTESYAVMMSYLFITAGFIFLNKAPFTSKRPIKRTVIALLGIALVTVPFIFLVHLDFWKTGNWNPYLPNL